MIIIILKTLEKLKQKDYRIEDTKIWNEQVLLQSGGSYWVYWSFYAGVLIPVGQVQDGGFQWLRSVGSPGVICYVSSLSAIDVLKFHVLYEVYFADDAKGLRLRCGYVDYFSLVMTINK